MYIFFARKHSKDKRYEKKIAKEKGFKSEMYVLTFPHKLFKCLLPKPKTLCTFMLLLLSQIHFFTNQPWACSLNKPTIQNLVKENAA
jgi:hypothetical protein